MLGHRGWVWDKMFRHVWKQLAARVRRQTNHRGGDRVSEETGDPQDPPPARPLPATRYCPVITPRRNLRNILNECVNHRGEISALVLSPKVDSARNATESEAGGS